MVLVHLNNPKDFYNVAQIDQLSNDILSTRHFWSVVFKNNNINLPKLNYKKAEYWCIEYEKEIKLHNQVALRMICIDELDYSDDEARFKFDLQTFNLPDVLNVEGVDLEKITLLYNQYHIKKHYTPEVKLMCSLFCYYDDNDDNEYYLSIDDINYINKYYVKINRQSIKQILYNALSIGVTLKYDNDDPIPYYSYEYEFEV
jgi:hypothetical protein